MSPIRNAINELAPMAAVFPGVLDRVDEDEMAEMVLESTGFPQKLIRTDSAVAEIRQARLEAMQKQEMMQMGAEASKAVPRLNKTPEEGSPMKKMMDMAGAK